MPERLTDTMVERGVLHEGQARAALERQVRLGGTLDTALLELGLVDEGQLSSNMAETYGLPAAEDEDWLAHVDERALRSFPERWAVKHLIAPLRLEGENTLIALSAAPPDVNLLLRLGELLELEIRPRLAPEFRIHQRLQGLYGRPLPERYRALLTAPAPADPEPLARSPSIPPAVTVPTPVPLPLSSPPLADESPSNLPASSIAEGQARDKLRDANERDDIGRATLEHAASQLVTSALFVLQDDRVEGWMGWAATEETVPGLVAPSGVGTPFKMVLKGGGHYLGPLPDDAEHSAFLHALGRPTPQACLIVPIRIRERTVALLYCDNGPSEIPSRVAADVMLFITHVQQALENLLLRRKSRPPESAESVSSTPLSIPPVDSSVPLSVPPPAETKRDVSPQVASSHPLLEDDEDAWESVDLPPDPMGAALDQTISAVRSDLADGKGLVDTSDIEVPEGGLADESFAGPVLVDDREGMALLQELDDLAAALERPAAAPSEEDGGWDEVDVDGWGDTHTPTPGYMSSQDRARASLTEDATVPDLSAEAWIRASSEVTRARPLPAEVMERAAMPAETDPVPLTRMTLNQIEAPSEPIPLTQRSDSEVARGVDDPFGDDPQIYEEDTASGRPTPTEVLDTTGRVISTELAAAAPGTIVDAEEMDRLAAVESARPRSPSFVEAAPRANSAPPGRSPSLVEPAPRANSAPNRTASFVEAPPEGASGPAPDPSQIHGWIEDLCGADRERQRAARNVLAQVGPNILPLVGDRFPGAVVVDPFAPSAELPPYAKCGQLLALLESFGRDAHPAVLRHLEHTDPLHRFFAIYFYAAVYVPEAIGRLIQRLHDEEPRICMMAARTLFSYREHGDFEMVLHHLHGRLRATSIAARRHAAYLIGLFRDVTAVPELIEVLERKDRALVDVAEDALAEITKQRFSGSAKKWGAWWSKNAGRSRIAWLIDGLHAKDEPLRRSAAEELRAVTGLDMGFDEKASRRVREEARQRWLKWWKEQEQAAAS